MEFATEREKELYHENQQLKALFDQYRRSEEYFERLLQIIEEHNIPNVIALRIFLEEHGEEYDLNLDIFSSVIRQYNNAEVLGLYFEGAYQRHKNELDDRQKRR